METTAIPTTTELIDTGEQRDQLGRRLTPARRRAELVAAFRASGLTQAAFARREGLKYSTFCTWAQAERLAGRLPLAKPGAARAKPTVKPATVNFAEVSLPTRAVTLEVRLPDGTVMSGGDALALAALVRALRN